MGNVWIQSFSSVLTVAGNESRAEEQDWSNVYKVWYLNWAPEGVFRHWGLVLQEKLQSSLVYGNTPAWATETPIVWNHQFITRRFQTSILQDGHLKKYYLILKKSVSPTDCMSWGFPNNTASTALYSHFLSNENPTLINREVNPIYKVKLSSID